MPSVIVDEASEIQTKRKYPVLKSAIESIEAHALTNGLADTALKRLIEAITSNSLDQTSQNALIKCLYPATLVSSDVVYKIISSLGHGTLKASVPTQQALIEWLIMVHELLEDTAALSRCYGVLFSLLDTTTLRAELCHLLSIITRKKHVKPFRILLLNDLSSTAGSEPALQKLMLVYEGYVPGSLDVGNISQKASLDFAHPDAEWSTQLERIQEIAKLRAEGSSVQDSEGESSSARAIHDDPATATEGKSNSIGTHDNIISSLSKPWSTKLTLSDLGNRSFQSRASLMPANDLAARIDDILAPLFEQESRKLENGRETSKALSGILEKILTFTSITKTLPKAAIQFFENYLPRWDDLQLTLLNPLETALLSSPTDPEPSPLITLLNFYTSLLAHWTSHLLSTTHPPTPTETTTIQSLTTHTTTLTLTLLTTTPPTPSTTPSILTHNQTHLLLTPLSIPLPPPSPLLISLLLFTPSLPTLSKTTTLLSSYKRTYESPPPRPPPAIRTLNATLIDSCNLLFRSRAFNTTDPHALGCLLPADVVKCLAEYTQSLEPPQPLGGLFALSSHSALAGLSCAALREMEEEYEEGEGRVGARHAGPVTQRSLAILGREGGVRVDWRQYRVAVLKWLDRMGVTGFKELGEATMKGLMGDQEGPKGSQDTALSQ